MPDLRLYRPPEGQRPSRRVRTHRQRIGELEWTPDTWQERLESWEWAHPKTSAAITLAIFLVAIGAIVGCMFLLEPR